MAKVLIFIFSLYALSGCSSSNGLKAPRKLASLAEGESLNCQLLQKGCLLKRSSKKLIIFFRGWVSPSMANRYGGSRKQVAEKDWQAAAEDLLFEDLALAGIPIESSLFVLGSSHLSLSMEELLTLMDESEATELIFASHSGGYKGMRQTLLPIPLEFWEIVSGIWLLDNYYGGAAFAGDLERNFGREFLQRNCFGFTTDHNLARFNSSYKSFCPQTLTRGVGHSEGVNVCLPFFEKGEECRP